MVTIEQLKADLVRSLKLGDAMKTGVLRFLLSELYNAEKAKQGKGEPPALSGEEITQAFQKEFKRRSEAIALFKKGNRQDLVSREEGELGIIGSYLPKQLGRKEIAVVVDRFMNQGSKDFASLMKEAMKEMKGKADGRLVAEVVAEQLNRG